MAKPFESGATFYGSFHGQVTEAMFSRFSWFAERSKYAENAEQANSGEAQKLAEVRGSQWYSNNNTKWWFTRNYMESGSTWADGPPVPPIVGSLNYGDFAIRDVQIDPANELKDRLGYTDEYQELFSKIPTTSEISSKFRIESNRDVLGAILVAEGRIEFKLQET